MRKLLTWVAGGLGAAALVRGLLRRQRPVPAPPADPADELRAKLEQARETADDRDEFDAAEGTPVDEVERPRLPEETPVDEVEQPRLPKETPLDEVERPHPPEETSTDEGADEAERQRSLEERRRAVHDKAQQALGHMRHTDDD